MERKKENSFFNMKNNKVSVLDEGLNYIIKYTDQELDELCMYYATKINSLCANSNKIVFDKIEANRCEDMAIVHIANMLNVLCGKQIYCNDIKFFDRLKINSENKIKICKNKEKVDNIICISDLVKEGEKAYDREGATSAIYLRFYA